MSVLVEHRTPSAASRGRGLGRLAGLRLMALGMLVLGLGAHAGGVACAQLAWASATAPGADANQPGATQPQAPTSQRPGIVRVDPGYEGLLAAERGGPFTVWVSGGRRGFSGSVSLLFLQDGTQRAEVWAPAAANPGGLTPVRLVGAMLSNPQRVVVSLRNDRGALVQSITLDGRSIPTLASLLVTRPGLVGRVGDATVGDAMQRATDGLSRLPFVARRSHYEPNATPPPPEVLANERWSVLTCVTLSPEQAPVEWAAYEGLDALVVRSDDTTRLDPRAVRAIKAWVHSGGRLIVMADQAGRTWRSWLPDGADGDLVVVDELNLHPGFASMQSLLDDSKASYDAALAQIERQGESSAPQAPAQPNAGPGFPPPTGLALPEHSVPGVELIDPLREDELPSSAFQALPRVLARPMTLTERGRSMRWSIRWEMEAGEGGQQGVDGRRGLIAEGPVGSGWVTLVGTDPSGLAVEGSRPGSRGPWKDAALNALRPWQNDDRDQEQPFFGYSMIMGSGAASLERTSVRSLSDFGVGSMDVPISDRRLFGAVGALLLVLLLLVGPIDYLVLRKLKLRQWAWLTGLGWVAGASAIAYALPSLLRGNEPSTLFRITSDDLVLARNDFNAEPGVQGELGAVEDGPTTLAWRSGLSGFLASRSGDYELAPMTPGAWWRGASSVTKYLSREPRGLPTVNVKSVPDQTGTGAFASLHLGRVQQGQWTLRSFLDQGPTPSEVRIALWREGHERRIRFRGLPAGAVVESAYVHAGHHVWTLNVGGEKIGSSGELATTLRRGSFSAILNWTAPPSDRGSRRDLVPAPLSWQGHALNLPGASRRDDVASWLAGLDIGAKAKAGSDGATEEAGVAHAMVCISMAQVPPDVTPRWLDGEETPVVKRWHVLRAMVPIEPGFVPGLSEWEASDSGSDGESVAPIPTPLDGLRGDVDDVGGRKGDEG
ncbi:MAG: hypothetical protein SFZ23_15490 [Planctomycetota bacterium]|nr:hypothetical protein [Planctomycetota bacterium]